MTTTYYMPRRVVLSNRMFVFLLVEINQRRNKDLASAKTDLDLISDETLVEMWDNWNSHEGVDNHHIEGPHDPQTFRIEFNKLFAEWGPHYELNTLLEASEEGVPTHCPLSEIEVGQSFEMDGEEGQGNHGVRRQWERVKIAGKELLDGQVVAKVTFGYKNDGEIELFDSAKVVRPHFKKHCFSVGSKLCTPEEVAESHARSQDYRVASDAIDRRVRAAINGKCRITYSAYESDDRDVPIDNLDEVAIQGTVIFRDQGDSGGKYESAPIENPTWLQVCVLFNDAVKVTKDYHHIFLEGVYVDEKATKACNDGIKVCGFCTGS